MLFLARTDIYSIIINIHVVSSKNPKITKKPHKNISIWISNFREFLLTKLQKNRIDIHLIHPQTILKVVSYASLTTDISHSPSKVYAKRNFSSNFNVIQNHSLSFTGSDVAGIIAVSLMYSSTNLRRVHKAVLP